MSLGKKDIIKNISSKARISKNDSTKILVYILKLLTPSSNINNIKISNFGTFSRKTTKSRVGRNPKTKIEYIIQPRSKIYFRASNKLKNHLN